MGLTVRMHGVVRGRVQGVGFRWFVREAAESLGVTGWVRNISDGTVEFEAQGAREALERFAQQIKTGHPYAKVIALETQDIAAAGGGESFEIR